MSYASPFQLALFGTGLRAPERTGPSQTDRHGMEERARDLAFALSSALHAPVRLAVTDNRSTMVSFQRSPSGLRLRIHHMFLDAPPEVVQALADYAGRGSERASALIDGYIRARQERIRATRNSNSGPLEPRGRCFDLSQVFDSLNGRFFGGEIRARIGWGRAPGKRRRKSIRLGVYDHQLREIRIHPALDAPSVPLFFVEFIVFHEMLHQVFPSTVKDLRRVHHPRVFRERERQFPLYAEALRWERENLSTLLRG